MLDTTNLLPVTVDMRRRINLMSDVKLRDEIKTLRAARLTAYGERGRRIKEHMLARQAALDLRVWKRERERHG